MKVMLLAAGRGERMGELTASIPKPLMRIGAESLIERQLRRLRMAGFREIVINVSWLGDQIRDALGDGSRYDVDIAWSPEGDPPLETAGGIVHALHLLGTEPFAVVNADLVTDFDFAQLADFGGDLRGGSKELLGTLVLVPNPIHHPNGDFGLDDDDRVTTDAQRLTYAGISVLHPDLFADCVPGPAPLRPVFERAIEARRLAGLRYDGWWIDVGTPARLEAARAELGRRP